MFLDHKTYIASKTRAFPLTFELYEALRMFDGHPRSTAKKHAFEALRTGSEDRIQDRSATQCRLEGSSQLQALVTGVDARYFSLHSKASYLP